ncbi:MAG: LamG domain-containing protein [Chloroflexi bacterium]|nr:LamG domain-containing protein [Chloroflexota bacterium]
MVQTWYIDNLVSIGGHPVEVLGSPRVVTAPTGQGLWFEGAGDAVLLPAHPLEGAARYTAEVIFCPAAGGSPEQRFFHLQEAESDDRILFETRLTPHGTWYLDTFIKSGDASQAQLAREHEHPLDAWYHAALVYDGQEMRHYVNGALELAHPIVAAPPRAGQTSIGVRINRVCWFRGAICAARFTPEALSPAQFWSL